MGWFEKKVQEAKKAENTCVPITAEEAHSMRMGVLQERIERQLCNAYREIRGAARNGANFVNIYAGAEPEVYERLKEDGFEIEDATYVGQLKITWYGTIQEEAAAVTQETL